MTQQRSLSAKKFTGRELLALNLIQIRAERGLSQEALSLEIGVDRTLVAHIERQARNASLDTIDKLARGLGLPISRLFELPNSRSR